MDKKKIASSIVIGVFLITLFTACNILTGIVPPRSEQTIPVSTTPSLPPTVYKTQALTFTETPTPLPTLSSDQELSLIQSLLADNNNCQLPCWWGITPGKTTWQEAELFLRTFARRIYSYKRSTGSVTHRAMFSVSSEIYNRSLIHTYQDHDGIVQSIDAIPGRTNVYSLPNVMTIYGQPDEVWITWINTKPVNNVVSPLRVILFYKTKGIMVQYSPSELFPLETAIQACPQREEYPEIFLWAVDDFAGQNFKELLLQTQMSGRSLAYLQIEEATGMPLAVFYDLFKNPANDICLETSFELWPMGKRPYK